MAKKDHDRGASPFSGADAGTPPDPTAHVDDVPRTEPSNDNPQVGSVGPGVPAGFGDVHAVYPVGGWHSTAWQGWPVGWETPFYSPITGGPGTILPGTWTGSAMDNWLSTVVWACVDLNSRALQQMPPTITKSQVVSSQVVQVPVFDNLPSWLTNPHPEGQVYTSWGDFIQALVVALEIFGEAFVVADSYFATGYPASFFVANNMAVQIAENPDPEGVGPVYRWTKTGEEIDNLLHIRYMTVPGDCHGHGPLEGSWRALTVVRALENYAAELASQGGVPWGVISSAVNLGKGGAEALQAQWRQAAANRRGGPAVLTGDIKLDMLAFNPSDMAMLDLLTHYSQRICAAFGVPPFLVGVPSPEGLTYSNANGLFDFHYRSTLKSLSANMMTALSGWALPWGTNVGLLAEGYVQPDLQTRTQAKQLMAAAGALTINEWRASEGLPPLPGGDGPPGVPAAPVTTPSAAELEAML